MVYLVGSAIANTEDREDLEAIRKEVQSQRVFR
jgi:hypothetical protein